MAVTRSLGKLERLLTALDAYNRADVGDNGTVEAARQIIAAQNVLIDTCVECGMPVGGDEFAFANRVVGRFLLSAA